MGSKSVSFDTLPEEIMENIIIYCDGKSLCNLLKTCNRWKCFIEESKRFILKKWGLICMFEIKQDFIIDILQKLYPRYWLGEEVCWKSVYKCWRQWSNLNFWTQHVEVLHKKTRSSISSLKFSGNWILISTHHEGVLEAVNFFTKEKVLLYHCNPVKDMYMRCYIPKEEALSIKGDMLLDDLEHDEVVLSTRYHYIIFNLHTGQVTLKCKLTSAHLTLRIFEGQEVTVFDESPGRACNLNVITNNKIVSFRDEGNMFCKVLQVWNGNILLLDCSFGMGLEGELRVTDYNFKPVDHPMTNYKVNMHQLRHPNRTKHYHLGVIIVFYGNEMEIIVNAKSKKYGLFSNLACRMMCAVYHAGVLLLGSDIGNIYVYHVNDDEVLLDLDLSNYNCCWDISSEPILALDIKETMAKPIIAAGSEQRIYILRFD